MKPELDEWTIVVPGDWNVSIINPEFIQKEIFKKKINIESEISIAPGRLHIRQKADGVIIIPSSQRLVLGASNISDDALNKTEYLAKTILDILSHTPIRALGINYGFMEEDPSPELISLFDLEDQDKISEAGYLIITKEINRELKMGEDGGTINLSHSFNGKRVRIKLNFHHDVTSVCPKIGKYT